MNNYVKKQLQRENRWKSQLDIMAKWCQSEGLERVWYGIRLDIWEWWYRRPFWCKFGFHKFSWESFWIDRNPKYMGQVRFECVRCNKRLCCIPIDDLPLDEQRKKLEFIKDTKQLESQRNDL